MRIPGRGARILLATKPVDFRKGHDGLAALVRNELRKDLFTGTVFVFRAKRADRLKLVFWDGTGLALVCKRLDRNSFAWPAAKEGTVALSRAQFDELFAGLDWRRARRLRSVRKTPEKQANSLISAPEQAEAGIRQFI